MTEKSKDEFVLEPGKDEFTEINRFLATKEREALEKLKQKYPELYKKRNALYPTTRSSK